jgi:hypothetical protein
MMPWAPIFIFVNCYNEDAWNDLRQAGVDLDEIAGKQSRAIMTT